MGKTGLQKKLKDSPNRVTTTFLTAVNSVINAVEILTLDKNKQLGKSYSNKAKNLDQVLKLLRNKLVDVKEKCRTPIVVQNYVFKTMVGAFKLPLGKNRSRKVLYAG